MSTLAAAAAATGWKAFHCCLNYPKGSPPRFTHMWSKKRISCGDCFCCLQGTLCHGRSRSVSKHLLDSMDKLSLSLSMSNTIPLHVTVCLVWLLVMDCLLKLSLDLWSILSSLGLRSLTSTSRFSCVHLPRLLGLLVARLPLITPCVTDVWWTFGQNWHAQCTTSWNS